MAIEHLIETTMCGYECRTWSIAPGFDETDLTDEEKGLLRFSHEYEMEYELKENKRLLKLARGDFERLRDIPGMPDEAIEILREWAYRDGDDEYGE